MQSGLYIVTLNNKEPISVNANDSRVAKKAIKVTKDNCKFGKSKDLDRRMRDYHRVFGAQNVNFKIIALLDGIDAVERALKAKLNPYCIRGNTNKPNEWLQNISPTDVEKTITEVLQEMGHSKAICST